MDISSIPSATWRPDTTGDDPLSVEGVIFDVKRFSLQDGPGIRTTVFFKGCPLRCPWCHNPEGLSGRLSLMIDVARCPGTSVCPRADCPGAAALAGARPDWTGAECAARAERCPSGALAVDGRRARVGELLPELTADRAYFAASGGGVTFSGGEPLAQPAFLEALLDACRREGLTTVVETAAVAPWRDLERLLGRVDHFYVDLKTGQAAYAATALGLALERVQDNLRRLVAVHPSVTVRVPVVPGANDDAASMGAMADFLADLTPRPPVELLPYHALGEGKYARLGRVPAYAPTAGNAEKSGRGWCARFQERGLDARVLSTAPRKPAALSPRNQRLKDRAVSGEDSRCPWEYMLAYTRGYRATPTSMPVILRRAHALAHALRTVPIHIRRDDVLLGETLRRYPGPPGVADQYAWVPRVQSPVGCSWGLEDVAAVPAEVREELSWWRGAWPACDYGPLAPVGAALQDNGLVVDFKEYFGHMIPNFAEALAKGYAVLGREARAAAARPGAGPEQRDFHEAVAVACDGACAFGQRYADEAERLAAGETDPEWRDELRRHAAICRQVPAGPARTFREALQMVWFVHGLNEAESPTVRTQSLGRFDQYLWPFYRDDLAAGRVTPEMALEGVEAFWIKCYRTFEQQHAMLGGVAPDGSDGTNELTFLCLDAVRRVGFPRACGVRVGQWATPAYWDKIAETLEAGMGVPAVFNDDVIVPALERVGLAPEHARGYGATGCIELVGDPATSDFRTVAFFVNFAKVLELAVASAPAGGPETFEALFGDFAARLAATLDEATRCAARAEAHVAATQAAPLFSCLMPSCREAGRDVTAGGARYNFSGVCAGEIAQTVDAFAAIRERVFRRRDLAQGQGDRRGFGTPSIPPRMPPERKMDGVLAWDELRRHLADDFARVPQLALELARHGPRFGDDDPDVDAIGTRILETFDAALAALPHPRGGRWLPLVFSRQHRQTDRFGVKTGAGADGRRAGAPLAVSLNPVPGTARKGPTAIFASQNRLPLARMAGGVSNNIDIHPSVFAGGDRSKLVALLKGWAATGGMEVALTVLGPEELRRAQQEPERHADLAVRVYGFSERFVNLDRRTQDSVIARMETNEGS